jgi:hypothetical protein
MKIGLQLPQLGPHVDRSALRAFVQERVAEAAAAGIDRRHVVLGRIRGTRLLAGAPALPAVAHRGRTCCRAGLSFPLRSRRGNVPYESVA